MEFDSSGLRGHTPVPLAAASLLPCLALRHGGSGGRGFACITQKPLLLSAGTCCSSPLSGLQRLPARISRLVSFSVSSLFLVPPPPSSPPPSPLHPLFRIVPAFCSAGVSRSGARRSESAPAAGSGSEATRRRFRLTVCVEPHAFRTVALSLSLCVGDFAGWRDGCGEGATGRGAARPGSGVYIINALLNRSVSTHTQYRLASRGANIVARMKRWKGSGIS